MKNFKISIAIVLILIDFLCMLYMDHIDDNKIYISKIKSKINTVSVSNTKYINDIKLDKIKVIAHRGIYLNEPENSMDGINDSMIHRVDYAEIDVQQTNDGVVVLMHDKSLKRLTGLNKMVNQLDYNEVEKLNIGSYYSFKYRSEKIPTLNQVIKKCNGKIKLIIEIKPYGDTKTLTENVVNIIEKNKFQNQCMIHSLSYNILLYVKRLNPNITTGYIIHNPINNLTGLNVNFYSVQENAVTRNLVMQIHKSNKKIYVWTVDNKVYMNDMLKLNVDGIITDRPSILMNNKKAYIKKI
ncbi:glycerophosphodiester phosphodiesterase family protein [Clostridium akagii]|uniref:glycerophosphodiester phosphodiesterase family protein n=1 Tax=Clostridium akagii TaxID=91623 RepID=UPI00047BDC91|nr:glycerophosphodiester phosphodiesterase family protein [Clostridium akagii]